VKGVARDLAAKPFQEEKTDLPPGLQNLTYEQYRDIRFDPEKSIWKGEPHGFAIDLFHPGFYYNSPVDIYIVKGNEQAKLNYVPDLFMFGPQVQKPTSEKDLHYSGFRLRYPINTKDVRDEFLVYQGASYFRAVGKGQLYGLSARGLAIDTGQPKGEEFPFFRSFWIKTPEADSKTIVIDALLNSQSATGAYRFTVKPGDSTLIDVEMMVFPRRDIDHAGIAPLTSMYLFGTLNKDGFDDYRLAVHDSDGLFMVNGREEWIWRPLANPKTLQVSAFQDRSPRGFGLIQRKHNFQDFLDLDLQYERRPRLWIEPIGDPLAARNPRQHRRFLAPAAGAGARFRGLFHLPPDMVQGMAGVGPVTQGAGAVLGRRAQWRSQAAPLCHRFRRRYSERRDQAGCHSDAGSRLQCGAEAQFTVRGHATFFRS
jgi:periplasmic glucans biosynthesis protein